MIKFLKKLLFKTKTRTKTRTKTIIADNKQFHFLCETSYGGKLYECDLGHIVHVKQGILHHVNWDRNNVYLYDNFKNCFTRPPK